jgi:hypothetical protein
MNSTPPSQTVHIELLRVQKWLFGVPRLRAMVGANALLGKTLRVELPELARATGRGWSLHPTQGQYPGADPDDPLSDHDDPAADAQDGILARDGGHFEAQFKSGATAFAEEARKRLRARLPGLRFRIWIGDREIAESQTHLPTELPVLAPCEWTGRGLASTIIKQGTERPAVSLDVAERHDSAKRTEEGTAKDLASLLSAKTKLQKLKRAQELKELVGTVTSPSSTPTATASAARRRRAKVSAPHSSTRTASCFGARSKRPSTSTAPTPATRRSSR